MAGLGGQGCYREILRETLMRRNGHRGSMSIGVGFFSSMLVFPSMPKGEIVG
jgi:hypothetical protein